MRLVATRDCNCGHLVFETFLSHNILFEFCIGYLNQLNLIQLSLNSCLSVLASTSASPIVISSATAQSILTSTASASSQPITVQIQNTPQGTRLMIPSGQLSQLRGSIHLLQTSGGQSVIATSQASSTTATTSSAVGKNFSWKKSGFSLLYNVEYKTVTSIFCLVVIHSYS